MAKAQETAEIVIPPLARGVTRIRIIGQTPLFQNRMTRYPLRARNSERRVSYSMLSACWLRSSSSCRALHAARCSSNWLSATGTMRSCRSRRRRSRWLCAICASMRCASVIGAVALALAAATACDAPARGAGRPDHAGQQSQSTGAGKLDEPAPREVIHWNNSMLLQAIRPDQHPDAKPVKRARQVQARIFAPAGS